MSVIERVSAPLPFSCEQVFDLVADIERYPQFLPGWISAAIQRREGDTCYVEQVLGVGPLHLRFTSTAVLQRPQRIDVTSTDPPFRRYSLTWVVIPCPPVGCRISVTAEFELQSFMMQHVVNQFLPSGIDDVVAAFAARARFLYEPPRA